MLSDVINEKVSLERARAAYGVVIREGKVDTEETRKLREMVKRQEDG